MIRKAKINDLSSCAGLSNIHFHFNNRMDIPETKRYLRSFMRKGIFLVAEWNSEIKGFIVAEWLLGGFIQISAFAATDEQVAKELISEINKTAKSKGVRTIYFSILNKNKELVSLFNHAGFKELEGITNLKSTVY